MTTKEKIGMKATCNQNDLRKALGLVAHVVPGASSLPIIKNILLSTENGRLKLAGTNLELTIVQWIGAKVENEGSITIPGRLLVNAVSTLQGDTISMQVDDKDHTLTLQCGKTRTKLKGESAEDFPPILTTGEGVEAQVDAAQLRSAILQASIAVSDDTTRPVLTGVYLKIEEQTATLVSSDSFRLAKRTVPLVSPVENTAEVIVPAIAMVELARALSAEQEPVRIVVVGNKNQVIFHLSNVDIVSQLIAGTFPDYARLIPTSFATRIDVSAEEFGQAIRAASIFLEKDVTLPIRLQATFQDDKGALSISTKRSSDNEISGENASEIECVLQGEQNKIGVDAKFLRSILEVLKAGQIILQINTPSSPCMFTQGNEPFLYVLMPMNIHWDDTVTEVTNEN